MRQHLQMRFATLVIMLVLGLQCTADVLMSGPSGWPFTDYPMYSRSHHEGERISGARYFVYATASDGREIEILPEHLGVNLWLFNKWAKQLTAKPQGRGSMSEAHSSRADRGISQVKELAPFAERTAEIIKELAPFTIRKQSRSEFSLLAHARAKTAH